MLWAVIIVLFKRRLNWSSCDVHSNICFKDYLIMIYVYTIIKSNLFYYNKAILVLLLKY